MTTQKKINLSVALMASLAGISSDNYVATGIYIILAGTSLFFGLPDEKTK